MTTESLKQQLFACLADVGKALANGNRLELLEFLAQKERSVETLAGLAGLSVANASQHLQHLRRAGLVTARKQDRHVFYAIAGDDVVSLLMALRRTAEKNFAEMGRLIDGFLLSRDSLEPVSQAELSERMREGLVTVIDVRPTEEFAAGHLSDAINIPLDQLDQKLSHLPTDGDVVAYCRGPYCLLAYEAVNRLRSKGIPARRLEDGFPEWKLAGLPVDRTAPSS
ncbi:MAG: metalloregulator ArsR/SmtB family transcription factor [Rhodospirillales bacterium]|nr:metalloregulator ArsR/SmtB family transcription factor [Alphaproteobacteria bacterium]MBL6947163.1 metalloregulator ArsR/SmtB family transcription factor [Rhodospirillales bacterium]